MKRDRTQLLLHEPSLYKAFIILALPIFAANFMHAFNDLIDTYFIGQIADSVAAQAGISVAWPVLNVLMSLQIGFSVAGVAVISQLLGSAQKERARENAGLLLILAATMGAAVNLIIYFCSPAILRLMGAEGGTFTNALDYPGVETRPQMQEEILLVVPRSHPLAHLADEAPPGELATVNLQQFREDEFLLAGEGTTLRTLENALFAQAGFQPRVAFETDSLSTLHLLSRGGYGLAFVPRFYAEETGHAVYFRTRPAVSWELVAAYRKDRYLTRAEEYMIELATRYYHQK